MACSWCGRDVVDDLLFTSGKYVPWQYVLQLRYTMQATTPK